MHSELTLSADCDGTGLIESLVIAEYLIRKYGKSTNSLLPSDPADLAKVQRDIELLCILFSLAGVLKRPCCVRSGCS